MILKEDEMEGYSISFAPMEGITGRIFRITFDKYFKGITDYYTPFIMPKEKRGLDKKDLKELLPENNGNLKIIPQILSNSFEAFSLTARKLKEIGYAEVNLNLGCPSGTVVNKGRGAGALKNLELLESLLYGIYNEAEQMGIKVSIKTRIGYEEPDEFAKILSIYKKYPAKRLIIHPRTRMEFYKGNVHKESFGLAAGLYEADKLCFNGEINCGLDVNSLTNDFPHIKHIMIGRGLLRNPFLAEEIFDKDIGDGYKRLKNYMDELFFAYLEDFEGKNAAVLKMKELWFYLKDSFNNSENYVKGIKKAKGIAEYKAAVNVLFSNCGREN